MAYRVDEISQNDWPQREAEKGKWFKARPIPDSRWQRRLRDAWRVFTMEYDAIIWYKQ